MILKRGLSPEELDQLDPELFNALFIYDAVIEPNGSRIDQIRYANLCHLILMSSGNLTEAGMKSAKVDDWDMFGLLANKTTKQIAKDEEKARIKRETDQFNAMAEMIKAEALKDKNKNGKK
ncbi:hypothetical protein ACO1ZG_16240 [Enterobacter kobei]|uniref:hypothetical protein n=1 Tax=Enterobacter kobei TaxID=208224 RepID=UPI003B8943B6